MTILVVEGDPHASAAALTEYGFRVLTSRTGEDAAVVLEREPELRAVVVELELEGTLKGWDVARLARFRHPNIPIVYTSGRLDLLLATSSWENARFVRKPCIAKAMVCEVASLLAETSS